MAKHDIVLLNVTSSNFETAINDNVARIKGDSDKLFSLQQSGSVDSLISVDSNNPSITFNARITSSGHISSSFNSTASFGRVNVTRLVGDASQMTNTNEVGHVSSSKQLASRISGAFTAGFTLEGENRLISGSRTSTGSFTRVFSNIYVGNASDMHSVNEEGHFSSSAQLASNISGSFTAGFNLAAASKLSGSATSTGSFGRVEFSSQIAGNAAAVTIDQSGHFSSSAQLADSISGSFIRGFNLESGSLIGTETPIAITTQSIKLDESDDFLKINPIFVSGSEGDDKLYGERRFTLSMWLKFNGDNGSRNTFIMAGAQSGALSGLYLWMQSNSITGEFKVKHGSTMDTANLSGIGGIEIGKWHHLLLSYESNRPTPNVSGSFLSALDGRQKTFEVIQSGSYITTTEPPGGGSTIGTYNVSSENTNITVADITMWKHSIQSASSDAGIDSGSLITTLFNHGIVPDYTASFSTGYPDAYREKLKFAFNFDSSSYAGSSYSMYDRTGNTGFKLTSNNVDEGKIVSGSGDYPTEGVFYTTGSFTETVASNFSGDASQVTGVGNALPANVLSGSGGIAAQISGAFTSGFVLQSKTTAISGSATSTGSFGTMVIGSTVGINSSISDTSGLTGFSRAGLISSSAQLATSISGSFTSGMSLENSLISGSRLSTGSFTLVSDVESISGDASQVTGVTLPAGVLSGSAQIASNISGAFSRGFEFTGATRGQILTASYVGVSGSAFAYAGNATTMSISSICGSDFDYRKLDLFHGAGIKGDVELSGGTRGAWTVGPNTPAPRSDGFNGGTVGASLFAGGYSAPTTTDNTIKFDGISFHASADILEARSAVVGAGTQNAAAIFAGQTPVSPYRQYVGYTEHYNGSTWSEQADRTGIETGGGGFGTQNAAVAVGGIVPTSPNYPNATEIWNGTSWSEGPDAAEQRRQFGSGGSSDAGMLAGGGFHPSGPWPGAQVWNGTTWSSVTNMPQYAFGASLAGDSNRAHVNGAHFQHNGGRLSQVWNGTAWANGPFWGTSRYRGFQGTNSAGIASCNMFVGGSSPSDSGARSSYVDIYETANNSTASFSRLDIDSLIIGNFEEKRTGTIVSSSLTGYESGHISGAAQLATSISGSFNKGFSYAGTISGSSASLLKIQELNLAGTSNFTHTDFRKNWDGSFVQTATFGNSLGARISGSFIRGFSYQGTISGSATSTGSFNQIKSQELFVKEIVGKRKPISGSMEHGTYISGSYKSDSHGRITIPTFGRGHQVNTQQFTATGSMNNQKYRARAGQLFVDNFGRLNMTVQTGSMVAVAGTWTEGPDNPFTSRGVQGVGFSYAAMEVAGLSKGTGSAQYDDIAWSVTADSTHKRDGGVQNKSVGTVDAAIFIGHTGGTGGSASPGNTGVPNFNDFFEIWDGVSFSRCGSGAGRISGYSWRHGAAAKGGSSNSHIVFGGDYGWAGYTRTSCWNGVNWEAASYNLNNDRCYGAGFGGVSDAVYAGGNSTATPLDTCTEEWNGATWATANATPSPAAGGGIGHSQNAGLVAGPSTTVQEYDGTSWSAGTSTLSGTGEHASAGSAGSGLILQGLGGSNRFQKWTGGFITGSADTYNNFSQNPTGRYLLTNKLQANYSPGTSGGVTSGSSDGYGGGY